MDDSASHSLAPTAQGTFATNPFPHVLIHALHHRMSGTFELSSPSGPAGTFLVLDGRPAKGRTMVDHYLLRVLAKIGALTENQVTNLLPRLLSAEELHGKALVRTKVLTQEQVNRGLERQLTDQMMTLVELPDETVWRYYDDVDLLAGWGAESDVRLDPYPFVWASLEKHPPWAHVRPALARASESAMRLRADANVERFGFDRRARAIADLLKRKAWRLNQLVIKSGATIEAVDLVAYCLMLTKQVDFLPATEADRPIDSAPDSSPISVDIDISLEIPSSRSGSTTLSRSPPTPREDPRAEPSPLPASARVGPAARRPALPREEPAGHPTPLAIPAVDAAMAPKQELAPLTISTPFPGMIAPEMPPPEETPQPPSSQSEHTRPTVPPPKDVLEPGYDVLDDGRPTPEKAPEVRRMLASTEVFGRPTIQRMSAVTADEIAAFAAKTGAKVPAPAPRSLPSIPRPLGPPPIAGIPRRPPPPPVIPGRRPAPPPPPESLNPTPMAFPAVPEAGIPTPPVTRRAMVPPEPDEGKQPARPATSPAATAGMLPKLPLGGPASGATIRDKPAPLSEVGAQSSRKTMEVPVSRTLIDATAAPPSGRPTVEIPQTPKVAPAPPPPPAPPPESSHKPLDLELDSPWDEGWDDEPAPKK